MALEIIPHTPTKVDLASLSVLTFPMARDQAKALGWVLQDSETMMFTVLEDAHFSSSLRPRPSSYILYGGPPSTHVEMLDLLVLEALQDPTRNARYKLDAVQCTHIAESLWLSILPS